MKYFILSYAGRILFPSLIVLSLIVLYRGHNLPGGGFIGGLLAATAYILIGLGSTMEQAKAYLRVDPVTLLAIGLAVAILSGLPGMLGGGAFLTGAWLPTFSLPLLGKVHLGTPLVFDVGVYLTVIGFTLHTTFSLAELGKHEPVKEDEI
ncbi:MAG: multicomponent Na+:H+ antiporter subunit B [Lentimonas sp.]|jgi:multicomponent Na+:H+ antiporter subunit B